jgi:hypothetical protein
VAAADRFGVQAWFLLAGGCALMALAASSFRREHWRPRAGGGHACGGRRGRLAAREDADMQGEQRLLTLADVEPAAQVIAEAFVDDPLCAFMLPRRRTRTTTLYKFFRAYGEINIKHGRGYGVGAPLQAVAFWKFPEQAEADQEGGTLPQLWTGTGSATRGTADLKQQEALISLPLSRTST